MSYSTTPSPQHSTNSTNAPIHQGDDVNKRRPLAAAAGAFAAWLSYTMSTNGSHRKNSSNSKPVDTDWTLTWITVLAWIQLATGLALHYGGLVWVGKV